MIRIRFRQTHWGSGMTKMYEINEIYFKAKTIVESDMSWESKYDLIFSEEISRKFSSIARGFDYYDPDTTYEEDVMAWYNSAHEYLWS